MESTLQRVSASYCRWGLDDWWRQSRVRQTLEFCCSWWFSLLNNALGVDGTEWLRNRTELSCMLLQRLCHIIELGFKWFGRGECELDWLDDRGRSYCLRSCRQWSVWNVEYSGICKGAIKKKVDSTNNIIVIHEKVHWVIPSKGRSHDIFIGED